GRLNDLIERASVQLKTIDVLVLDEADRMLDMGFLPQVRRIIKHLPKARQTMLLTATLSREVERLAQELLRLRESRSIAIGYDCRYSHSKSLRGALTRKDAYAACAAQRARR